MNTKKDEKVSMDPSAREIELEKKLSHLTQEYEKLKENMVSTRFFWISLRFNYMSCLMKFVTRHATWSFKTSLFHSLIFGGKNVNYPHTINKKSVLATTG